MMDWASFLGMVVMFRHSAMAKPRTPIWPAHGQGTGV